MNRDEKLKMLAEELDGLPEEIYDDLLLKLAETGRDHLNAMVDATRAGDHDEAARLAHAIKGGAANLRVHDLRAAAEAVELDLRATNGQSVGDETLELLEQALKQLEQSIAAQ